jgi:hypothetical protein
VLAGAVLLALLVPDVLPLRALAKSGVLVAVRGEIGHVLGIDHILEDLSEGEVRLAEMGGIERCGVEDSVRVRAPFEFVGELADSEGAGLFEVVEDLEPEGLVLTPVKERGP